MKPAARAFSRPRRAFAALLLLAAAFLAGPSVAIALPDANAPRVQHFTQARVLTQPIDAPAGDPPRQFDAAALTGEWKPVTLPYAWPRAVVPGSSDHA